MQNDPINLIELFSKKLFRIPDYQRGYAWGNKQLKSFWQDLLNVIYYEDRLHYTGVITLEDKTDEFKDSAPPEDKWRFPKGERLYHVVDGQQRLTTFSIFIRAFVEVINEYNFETLENGISIADIEELFLFKDKPRTDVQLRSYHLAYQDDSQSNSFMKNEIYSSSTAEVDTLYTLNLKKAKDFFIKKLQGLLSNTNGDIELDVILSKIYRAVSERFVFNEYHIKNDLDVFISFEAMNYRGKDLSTLELLKNRLIFLTTLISNSDKKLDEDLEALKLREDIKETWKKIYRFLGKVPNRVLSDDDFLRNHWIMYFAYSRKTGSGFRPYLLDKFFNPKRLISGMRDFADDELEVNENDDFNDAMTHDEVEDVTIQEFIQNEIEIEGSLTEKLTAQSINHYVQSLNKSVEIWFSIHHPSHPSSKVLDDDEVFLLERLNRLGFSYFRPLILALFSRINVQEERTEILNLIEQFIFTVFRMTQKRSNTGDSHFYGIARKLYGRTLFNNEEQIGFDEIKDALSSKMREYFNVKIFEQSIQERFQKFRNGYYSWIGLRYFLFEYELNLKGSDEHKIDWKDFRVQKTKSSIEHIYPQKPDLNDWPEEFQNLSKLQQHVVKNSLGNLLALRLSKNIQLQNYSFEIKRLCRKDGQDIEGLAAYSNGSHSEQQVNTMGEDNIWNIEKIFNRGELMLTFLKNRWLNGLHDDDLNIDILLGKDFLAELETE